MLSQRVLPRLTILAVLLAPVVSAAPMGVSLSRDIVKQIIADNPGHISAASQEVVQSSPSADSVDTHQPIAQFNALRQATLIVSEMVKQAPDKTPEATPVSAEPPAIAIQQAAVDTEQLIAEAKSEVDTVIDATEPTAAGTEPVAGLDFATLLAANDFHESPKYQSYEGLAFGDTRHRVRNGFWTNFKAFSAERRDTDTMSGFDASGESFTAGLETDGLMSGALFGAAMTMSKSRIDDKPNQERNDIRSFTGSLYSSWKFDSAFLEAGVSFGRARNETRRMATVGGGTGHLESKYYASTAHARLLVGNVYSLAPNWTLTPLAELNYNRISFDSYTEKWDSDCTGTCTDPTTQYQPDSQSSMEGGLGFNLAGNLGHGRARLVPFVSIMGYHNFRRDASSQRAIYTTGIDQVLITAPERNRGRARFSFGLSLILDQNFRLDLGVIRNQMKGYKNDSANLKIRYSF
ncbi:autotransporter outer membrane beta-barrel domain-containing protein [Kistimonas asteriae]|uniref:autotransporter outer membrane beta-barrel domain-containing protein n=1 Tax=Kistimonas asteriae TaxID=517724 RepID=UPI001BAAD8C4|nr:autotransporter outer membrane beta-barrel domain-containing protein [Kistimonas asteriae]